MGALGDRRSRVLQYSAIILLLLAGTLAMPVTGGSPASEGAADFRHPADDPDFVIEVGQSEVGQQGETVEIGLRASGQSWLPFLNRLDSFVLTVTYDEAVVTFEGTEQGDFGQVEVVDEQPGAVTLASTADAGSGLAPLTLADLQFTVVGDPAESTQLGVENATLTTETLFGEVERHADAAEGEITVAGADQRVVGFEAVSEGGFLAFDEPTKADAVTDGRQFSDEAVTFEATVEPDGTWESGPVDLPGLSVFGLPTSVRAPDGLTGTIDTAEDRLTAAGHIEVTVLARSFGFDLDATTDESGALTGDAAFGAANGTATLVDNEFTVEGGTRYLLADGLLGVPSPRAGTNWFELPLAVEFETVEPTRSREFVAANTDGSLAVDRPYPIDSIAPDYTFDPGTVRLDGELAANGSWHSTAVEFDTVSAADLETEIRAPNGLEGYLDTEDQFMNASGRLVFNVVGAEFGFDVDATTRTSGLFDGFARFSEDGGTARLVDDEFVLNETGDPLVDATIGLPSLDPDHNWFDLTLAIDLAPDDEGGAVDVTVVDQLDEPIENATVTVGNQSVRTDRNGTARISAPAGEQELTVTADGERETISVTVQNGSITPVTSRLPVREEGAIELLVTDRDGEPVSDATVTVFEEGGFREIETRAIEDGKTTIALSPGGYDFRVDRGDRSKEFTALVESGSVLSIPLRIPRLGTLEVTVVNETGGEPLDGVPVAVGGRTRDTDEAGQASFDLRAGSYNVTATVEGDTETTVVDIGPGETLNETVELSVPAVPTVGDEIPASFELFDELMLEYRREFGAPGAVLGIAINGEPVIVRGYGWRDVNRTEQMTVDSTFRIASLSKRPTRVAADQLVQETNITYETNLFERLDLEPLGGPVADERIYNITLRQALDHELGWDRDQSGDPVFDQRDIALDLGLSEPPTTEQIVRHWMTVPLDFEPGTDTAYSNIGYSLVELLIEQETGQEYETYLQQEVFAPAGIEGIYRGETFPEDRPAREVEYDDDLRRPRVDVLDEAELVPYSDGGFEMGSVAAPAGLVSSAEGYLEFLSAYDITTGAPRDGAVNQTDWQTGRITYGTLALAVQVDDPQLDVVALFNSGKRGFDEDELTEILERVADELGIEFGEPPVPTG